MFVVHINMAKSWRGGERQTAFLMEGLAQKQMRQLLICRKKSPLETYCIKNKIPYRSFTKNISSYWQIPSFIKSLENSIGDTEKIVLHAHESAAHTYALLAKTLANSPFPIVVHRRVVFPVKQKFSNRFKYSEKYIERIICISEAVEKVLQSSTGYNATVVIPSMVKIPEEQTYQCNEFDLRKKYNINADKIVAYIAALEVEKDHYTFIETAVKVLEKQPSTHFLIIGEGSLEVELKGFAKESGIQPHLTFTGFIPNAEQVIPQTDLLLFTSASEGLGSTILDYLANKRAVVSTRNGGAETVIKHGENGFLSDVGDSKSLAQYVLLLLNDRERYQKITEEAYNGVKEKYHPKAVTEKIAQVYRQLKY